MRHWAEDQKEKLCNADYDCELKINCHGSVMRCPFRSSLYCPRYLQPKRQVAPRSLLLRCRRDRSLMLSLR